MADEIMCAVALDWCDACSLLLMSNADDDVSNEEWWCGSFLGGKSRWLWELLCACRAIVVVIVAVVRESGRECRRGMMRNSLWLWLL